MTAPTPNQIAQALITEMRSYGDETGICRQILCLRSSRFQFAGLFDIREETIGGELVATLPVASNLPWIAALIGGLPAAAGVYVVSKVFTRQVDRFSSGVYSISGPWGNPEVKFERIFDNTASHQKAVATGTEPQVESEAAVPPG